MEEVEIKDDSIASTDAPLIIPKSHPQQTLEINWDKTHVMHSIFSNTSVYPEKEWIKVAEVTFFLILLFFCLLNNE